MKLITESILLKMTPQEKNIIKQRAAEKGITVTALVFDALKMKRRERKPRIVKEKNLIHQAA